jgi:hypothetical protein
LPTGYPHLFQKTTHKDFPSLQLVQEVHAPVIPREQATQFLPHRQSDAVSQYVCTPLGEGFLRDGSESKHAISVLHWTVCHRRRGTVSTTGEGVI